MRISDWSSDVCSSDLGEQVSHPPWSRGGGSAAADGGELVGAGPGVAVGGLHLLRPSREQADELIEVVADVAQDRLAGRVGGDLHLLAGGPAGIGEGAVGHQATTGEALLGGVELGIAPAPGAHVENGRAHV